MSTTTDSQAGPPLRPAFVFLGGLLAWLLSFIALWFLAEVDCASAVLEFEILGVPAAVLVGLVITLLAAFTALAAGHIALLNGSGSGPESERPFVRTAGAVLNGLFVIAILAGGLPWLLLNTCS